MSKIQIHEKQRKLIRDLIDRYLPNTEIWAYGSRIRGGATIRSDLDLVAFTTEEQKHELYELREAFEESDLPFRVDLFTWDALSDNMQHSIEQEYVVF